MAEIRTALDAIKDAVQSEYDGLTRRLREIEGTSSYLAGNVTGEVDTSDECKAAVRRTVRLSAQMQLIDQTIGTLESGFRADP
ncbi:hypothetical protein [Consotaella aegiceratis]|uniref:hypothetical protein n=1 Tax=Consotaella aegiceratis TaxID=3097961 RepID=UPI002F424166